MPYTKADAFHIATLFDHLDKLNRLFAKARNGEVESVKFKDGTVITMAPGAHAMPRKTLVAAACSQIFHEAQIKMTALARYGFEAQFPEASAEEKPGGE